MYKSIPGHGLRCGKRDGLKHITRKVALTGGRQSVSIVVRNDRTTVQAVVTVVRGQEVLLLQKAGAVVLPAVPVVRVSLLDPAPALKEKSPEFKNPGFFC